MTSTCEPFTIFLICFLNLITYMFDSSPQCLALEVSKLEFRKGIHKKIVCPEIYDAYLPYQRQIFIVNFIKSIFL
jgi:hypothetical protein